MTLGDVCKIKHGYAFKGQFFCDTPTEYSLVTPTNFAIGGGFQEKYKYYNGSIPGGYILSKGDLIVSMTDLSKHGDTLGYSALVPQSGRYLHNQRIGLVTITNPCVTQDYIYWLMRTRDYQRYIVSHATGTTVKHTAPKTILAYQFAMPSLSKQEVITSTLNALDDKININKKVNHCLEQMAQAIFKSWFVDFEPWGGVMPDDWQITKVGDLPLVITDYVANGSFATLKENVTLLEEPNYAIFIRNTDLKTGKFEKYVDEHSYRFLSKTMLFGDEVIISNVGDVGSVFLCPYLTQAMTLGNNMIMLNASKEKAQNYFFYLLFKYSYGAELIQLITGGSVQLKFNKTDFRSLQITMPTSEIMKKFTSTVECLFQKRATLLQEIAYLADLRDSLLPRLMSGEITIKRGII